jgi:hypothetical protein
MNQNRQPHRRLKEDSATKVERHIDQQVMTNDIRAMLVGTAVPREWLLIIAHDSCLLLILRPLPCRLLWMTRRESAGMSVRQFGVL